MFGQNLARCFEIEYVFDLKRFLGIQKGLLSETRTRTFGFLGLRPKSKRTPTNAPIQGDKRVSKRVGERVDQWIDTGAIVKDP